ncbi:MAG TPA: peptide deformylase [Solirubrobacterales bacterium]|nr:peptide deformylase [Solirubrobacterales bacterium]
MAVREVLIYPAPILKEVAREATPAEAEEALVDLHDTMRAHDRCVGIAAPQIGIPLRIALVDISSHPHGAASHGMIELVNPEITHRSEGTKVSREGCLSLPDLTANVRRPRKATVETRGRIYEVSGFEARCVLHEIDHLDGILFLDRVASITDDIFRRET